MNRQYNNPSPGDFRFPDSRPIERQVLADLIYSPEFIPIAQGSIVSEMFSNDQFRKVWDILNEMTTRGENIDLATIYPRTDSATMTELLSANGTGTSMAVTDHCTALREMYTRRTIFLHSLEMLRMSSNGGDITDLLSRPGKLVGAIEHNPGTKASTRSVVEVLNDVAEEIQANQAAKASGKRTRVPTGFQFLDELTYGGFKSGNLVILAARPTVGKSAVMIQMAVTATRAGFPATIYSLEMENNELVQRMLFSAGKVTPDQLSSREVNWPDLEDSIGRFSPLPVSLNDEVRTMEDIVANIIADHQQGKCEVAFIDYLGLIAFHDNRTIYQQVTDATRKLKLLAKSCHIPVVLLCQLNRDPSKDDREPQLHDLRDSGSIEQDADIVLMLERKNDYDLDLWVRKNRQGRAGNVCIQLTANESYTEFHKRVTGGSHPDPL